MARLSPWVLAGIGCVGVAALGVVGIGGLGLLVSKSVKEELSKPVDTVALLKTLNLPIHPKAELDEEMTRTMRAGSVMATKWAKLEMTMLAFKLAAPQEEVKEWYKKTLKEKGYQLQSETKAKTTKLTFTDKNDTVTVDIAEPSLLMLMRMKTPGK